MCYGQIALGTARYRARKSHGRCAWCDEPILAGERYERTRIIDADAGPYVLKDHLECAEAARREAAEVDDGCLYLSQPQPRGKTWSEHEATKGATDA